ncbi:P2X purinoceptor 6 isoform X7 [Balearica regulorum gibbericeps]|uniref:P2X purinoceptor 6 isoform X7 n=1 Tax=Balearica regulorum gibbericeps TaxID=100784 RepID=UPI003F5F5F39
MVSQRPSPDCAARQAADMVSPCYHPEGAGSSWVVMSGVGASCPGIKEKHKGGAGRGRTMAGPGRDDNSMCDSSGPVSLHPLQLRLWERRWLSAPEGGALVVPRQRQGLLFSPAAGLPDLPHPTPPLTAPLSPVSGAILCKPMTPPISRAAHTIRSSTHPALSSVSVTWWRQLERPLGTSRCCVLQGGSIGVHIKWDCNLDHPAAWCQPQYSFSLQDRRYNFRTASYYWDSQRRLYRNLLKLYGIRFDISVHGQHLPGFEHAAQPVPQPSHRSAPAVSHQAGKFSIIPTAVSFGTGIALFGAATVVCDLVLLYLDAKADFYRKEKFEEAKPPKGKTEAAA